MSLQTVYSFFAKTLTLKNSQDTVVFFGTDNTPILLIRH